MNRSYRSIWNNALNSWVAAAENVTAGGKRCRSGRFALAGLLVINPLTVLAANECGAPDANQTVVCTGSTNGNVSYQGNIDVLLDGTTSDGPVSLSGVGLSNFSIDNGLDMKLGTQGPVSIISGGAQSLISLVKNQGSGDLVLNVGAGTNLYQTGTGYTSAISLQHYHPSQAELQSRLSIAEGASVVVDKAAGPAVAISASHISDGGISLSNAGLLQAASATEKAIGIDVSGYNSVTVENSGQIILQRKLSDYGFGWGIAAQSSPVNSVKPNTLRVTHSGTIQGDSLSEGTQYTGISAQIYASDAGGDLLVQSSGDITGVDIGIYADIYGEHGTGLVHQSAGAIEAEHVGVLMSGTRSEIELKSSGKITTGSNADTKGVYITSASGGLLALGRFTQEAGGIIEDQGTGSDSAGVYVDRTIDADIKVSGKIRSQTGNGVHLQEASREYIAVGPSGAPPYLLEAAKSVFKVDVRTGGQVEGGSSGAGISIIGGKQSDITLQQGAALGALSDAAIKVDGSYSSDFQYGYYNSETNQWETAEIGGEWLAPGQTTVRNAGTITGVIQLGSGQDALINQRGGVWNLRSFADSDGDQSRDTLAVAVSRFATPGLAGRTLRSINGNSIVNQGTINVLGDNGLGRALDDSGAYQTGYAANTMGLGGPAQAQILGVQTFTNGGIINMQEGNNVAGDVLLISGGYTPGTAGGGAYVSDGGSLKVDTVLNEGGSNSQSDMLVVDSTRLGSAATTVYVNVVGGGGAPVAGNGIELIRVLDGSQSADGVFKLGGRVVAGAYDYDLYRGSVNAEASDGNWYLRPLTERVEVPPPGPGVYLRPEAGVYLRNMVAASNMFVHSLYSRYGEPQYEQTYLEHGSSTPPATWVRLTASQTDSRAADGRIELDSKETLLHFGSDIYRKATEDNGQWRVGLMGAYGRSEVDADPVKKKYNDSGVRRRASGKVEGYSIGGYATWYGNRDSQLGPYVDSWAQYAWYKNSLQGYALPDKEKYNSTGWTTSLEGGYAFVASESERRRWIIAPQAQVAYNSYQADDHREENGTWVRDADADGAIYRLGARFYGQSKLGDRGVQPFVETNWWYSDANNSLNFAGDVLHEDTPNSRYELKVGLQGNLTKNLQLHGYVSGQRGENNYRRNEGMLGVKYSF